MCYACNECNLPSAGKRRKFLIGVKNVLMYVKFVLSYFQRYSISIRHVWLQTAATKSYAKRFFTYKRHPALPRYRPKMSIFPQNDNGM